MSRNASSRSVALNTASSYVTLLFGGLLGLASTPILFHRLGTVAFGTWSLISGAVTYLALLEAGLGLATITRVAASEDDGPEALGRLLSTTLALFGGLAAVGVVLAGGMAAAFPLLFHVPPSGGAQMAMLILGVWQSVTFVASTYTAGLLGTGRMYVVNFRGFAVSAVTTVAQIGVVVLGGGLIDLALTQLLGGLATLLVFRRHLRLAFPATDVRLRLADRSVARVLLGLGWRNAVSNVSFTIASGSDVLLVGLFLTPAAAAAYALALRGFTLLQRLATAGLGAVGPVHARGARSAPQERRFRVYCLSLSMSLFVAMFGGLTVAVYAGPLLRLWLGRVPAVTPTVTAILCAVLIFQMPGLNAYSLLMNSEQASELMRIVISSAIVNLIASVAFTMVFGTIGPALGTLLAVLVFDAAYLPLHVCRSLGKPYAELVARVFVPLVGPAALMVGILAAGRFLITTDVEALGVGLVAAIAFMLAGARMPAAREVWGSLRADRAGS